MPVIWNIPKVELLEFSKIEETRPVLLVTSSPAWHAVKGQLQLPVVAQVQAYEASLHIWSTQLESIQNDSAEVVYAVGGGLAADMAKFFAIQCNIPLICLPTAISVDAFLTATSGIRKDGCVYYIETKPPDTVILDMGVIASAPLSVRSAGIIDVVSIATGSWDWKFAQEKGKNPPGMELIPWVYDNAQAILRGVLDCAEAAGAGDPGGLKQLFDCLALEVQLCNQIGHARPEEGSEHYFAYAAENVLGHGLPHGNLVGPGIIAIAQLQGQSVSKLERALLSCHVPLSQIPYHVITDILLQLPDYVVKHNLPYGIAHEMESFL